MSDNEALNAGMAAYLRATGEGEAGKIIAAMRAYHRAMSTPEASAPESPPTEYQLREMIQDPRYWRDREPEFVRRVTAGYRALYPE